MGTPINAKAIAEQCLVVLMAGLLGIVAVAVILVVLVLSPLAIPGIAIYSAVRWAKKRWDASFQWLGSSEPSVSDNESLAVDESLKNVFAGTMPMSIRVRGRAVRYHSRKYFFSGKDFPLNFVDDERKLSKQERYAGRNINCGHFFAFNDASAREEIGFYGEYHNTHGLLTVEGELDNILDLTSPQNIEAWRVITNSNLKRSHFLYNLVTVGKGGGGTTDVLGRLAVERGYNGIVFYSARTLESEERDWMEFGGSDFVAHYHIELLQKRVFRQCLVVFSGPALVSSIHTYWFDNGVRQKNPYFGRDIGEIVQAQKASAPPIVSAIVGPSSKELRL